MGILRTAITTWAGLGLIALNCGAFMISCAPVTTADGTPRIHINMSKDDARLSEAVRLWSEESGATGDAFTAGKAAYDIADVTNDPKWARVASRRLAEARKALPGFAQATAWQGAAQALIARDYPLRGAWQALPGPGFVRIYHVKRAEALLNEAVAEAPGDPVVRLLRAATISSLPRALTERDTAMQDFALLAQWEADPDSNPGYAAILASRDWRRAFHDAHAQAGNAQGDH